MCQIRFGGQDIGERFLEAQTLNIPEADKLTQMVRIFKVKESSEPMMPAPKRMVFAPDVIGGSFFDPDCAHAFQMWRDGVIQPVLNRPLLMRYLKLLRALDLPPLLIRRWAWWFTAPDRIVWIDSDSAPELTVRELCVALAKLGSADCILMRADESKHGVSPMGSEAPWISAKAFLNQAGSTQSVDNSGRT